MQQEPAELTNCLRPSSRLVRNFLVRMVQAVSPMMPTSNDWSRVQRSHFF